MDFCGLCGNEASRGRRCTTCRTVLCRWHSSAYQKPLDRHGHAIEVHLEASECLVCAQPKLNALVAAASSLDWFDCSLLRNSPPRPWPTDGWQTAADQLRLRFAPREFAVTVSGAIRERKTVRLRGWALITDGVHYLREGDLRWGHDPATRTPKAKWLASFGSTSQGPINNGAEARHPDPDDPIFRVPNAPR